MDVWDAFGMGRNYRYYGINSISANLGPEKSVALPVFHAISGCDMTSAFRGKGKKVSVAGVALISRCNRNFRPYCRTSISET